MTQNPDRLVLHLRALLASWREIAKANRVLAQTAWEQNERGRATELAVLAETMEGCCRQLAFQLTTAGYEEQAEGSEGS